MWIRNVLVSMPVEMQLLFWPGVRDDKGVSLSRAIPVSPTTNPGGGGGGLGNKSGKKSKTSPSSGGVKKEVKTEQRPVPRVPCKVCQPCIRLGHQRI